MRRRRLLALFGAVATALAVLPAAPAAATPVCTDGYKNGPPQALCGGRIFPEAEHARAYVQWLPDARGFKEYRHGLEYLSQQYPRWVSVFRLSEHLGEFDAVSAGFDEIRADHPADTGDGHDILVVKITDHQVPDEGKKPLFFSLSVHGNERGGLEGGVRTAEDLAMAAEDGGTIVDGYDNYESTTGREPEFSEYEVADVLAEEVVYLVDFNIDGWVNGEVLGNPSPGTYSRGNSMGTDLNRQMPTVGRINRSRNPLQETEMRYGLDLMEEAAALGEDGLMAHAADIHGELTSNAYVDLMYPAGQFDSVDHRRLMAIAERTKSVIDEHLYEGIIDLIESQTGGNESSPSRTVPTKPAHWATVWDTLGYTDTGFIGDYMATDLGITGMDHEIFLNHFVPERAWNVYLQENHITATRAIIKTAMAYALTQEEEFSEDNVTVDPQGRAGYVVNPDTVTDTDEDGPGRLPGPDGDGIGADGEPVEQASYDVTNQQWFTDTSRLMGDRPFVGLRAHQVATGSRKLDELDTLVLADVALPQDEHGPPVAAEDYYASLRDWVERGGNLVLTDRAVHALGQLGIVDGEAVEDIDVYLPHADIADFDHPMVQGLRANARQLVETTVLGYGINSNEVGARMTVVDEEAFTAAGGAVVGHTDGQVSVGELSMGDGLVRVVGGALPMPTEANDHRNGLRDYGLTYTGLFIMENSIVHDAPALGDDASGGGPQTRAAGVVGTPSGGDGAALAVALLCVLAGVVRRRVVAGRGRDPRR